MEQTTCGRGQHTEIVVHEADDKKWEGNQSNNECLLTQQSNNKQVVQAI